MYGLNDIRQRITKAFAGARFENHPGELYEPINYTLDLGGKRLRPVLVLIACDLFGGDMEQAIYPAMGLEIFHNFTLLHDDIMDNAPLRRGKETVHKRWDTNTAILSGDTMFVIAYEYVAKTNHAMLPQVLDLFNDTARKVCEGQQYDMNYESLNNVSVADYMLMIRLKTAVLIACSLKLGAILAHADPSDAEKIYQLGIELGLAFQLQDDYLDAFGDTKKFGKAIGGDIATNKKTFLLIRALELAQGESRTALQKLISGTGTGIPNKIRSVLDIYHDLKIDRITLECIEHHNAAAMKILDSFGFPDEKTEQLVSLMKEMLGRDS